MNSDPPLCKYVNEDIECEDSLAKEMCPNACRRFEGNLSDAFIFKFCDWMIIIIVKFIFKQFILNSKQINLQNIPSI